MAQYTYTSIYEIVSRITRNIKITDVTYADDVLEWIGEGIGRLKIKSRLNKTNKELTIKNYTAKLPCGLNTVDGVIYNGCRIHYGFAVVDPRVVHDQDEIKDLDSFFVHDTSKNYQNIELIRGLDLKEVQKKTITNDYYYIELGYLKTSFKEGCVTLLYKESPTDEEGYPLIPEIETAKEGLFWYVTSKLVFSGFKLADPRHDFSFCDDKAIKFFRQAKNEIKSLGLDEKESMKNKWVRLIPPNNYYENFDINVEQR